MSISLNSLPNVYRCGQRFYNAQPPERCTCPITQELMEEPVQANCGGEHYFDKIAIEHWLRTNSTCPLDREPITETPRSRLMQSMIQDWQQQHVIEEIEPSELASRLLTADTLSNADRIKLAAHLRYAQLADTVDEVATNVIRLSAERNLPIDNLQNINRSEAFDHQATETLNYLVQTARPGSELSPRSLRHERYFRGSAQLVRQYSEAMERLQAREEAREAERAAAQKRIADEEAFSQRPLSTTERLTTGLAVVGILAANPIARGLAAVMDNDPTTTFAGAAVEFDPLDAMTVIGHVSNLAYQWKSHGNAGIRKLNQQIPGQLMATAMTGTREYVSTLRRNNAKYAADEVKETQKKAIEDLRSENDSIKEAQKKFKEEQETLRLEIERLKQQEQDRKAEEDKKKQNEQEKANSWFFTRMFS